MCHFLFHRLKTRSILKENVCLAEEVVFDVIRDITVTIVLVDLHYVETVLESIICKLIYIEYIAHIPNKS